MEYGQFCPVAKATEILGDRWTMLIVRELLMGGTRFNVLQRGLSSISPTMLSKRLNELADCGIIIKKKIPGQKGYEYFLTECGQELMPLVEKLGVWGMRWARGKMSDTDLDVELLMLYLQRSVNPEKLPGRETVIRFTFTDLRDFNKWWLVINNDGVDACVQDPGKEVDIYFTTDLKTMTEAWMGDISYKSAIGDKRMTLVGPPALIRNVSSWMADSIFAGIEPASNIM